MRYQSETTSGAYTRKIQICKQKIEMGRHISSKGQASVAQRAKNVAPQHV